MSAPVIPTSGVARRRAKAIRNQQAVYDADVQRAFERNTFPELTVASEGCSCGWKQWLMPTPTDEDWRAFYDAGNDHQQMHEWEEDYS